MQSGFSHCLFPLLCYFVSLLYWGAAILVKVKCSTPNGVRFNFTSIFQLITT